MATLKVQEFLRSMPTSNLNLSAADSLELLKAKYAIDYKQHSLFPNLWLLKYNQIESNFNEEIVRECRGLILNAADDWGVVACPFFKFGNLGESYNKDIDWKTAKVQEKLDGSLCSVWWYHGWNVSTSGCPDGMNQINDTDWSFGKLFWDTFNKQGLYTNYYTKNHTYMFELTSPFNRVVVDHKTSKVTLIGIRNNDTLKEVDVDSVWGHFLVNDTKAYVVKSYPITNLDDCIVAANKLNPLEHEGFVVVDANFNRVKIKSPAYVALHHIKDSSSLSKMAEVVRLGEVEEFSIALEGYPEIKVKFLQLVEKYKEIVDICNKTFAEIKDIENQKEFALKACQTPYSSVLFFMRKTGKSPQAIIKDMTGPSYLRLIGVK